MSSSASELSDPEEMPDSFVWRSLVALAVWTLKADEWFRQHPWVNTASKVTIAVLVLFGLFYLMGASSV